MRLPALERVSGWHIVAILCGLGLAVITFLDLDRRFGNGDEVLYAQSIREMVRSGEYGTLRWQGHEGVERPPAPFVLAALGSRVIAGETGLRLTSALASGFIAVAIFLLARRVWRRWDAALVAVLLCAGAPSFHLFSRSLLSDPPFVAALMIALWGTVCARSRRRGLVIAGLGLGAAVACKSLAAGIPGLALAPWLVVAARRHKSFSAVAIATAAFAALALPFFVHGFIRFGAGFAGDHLGHTLVERAAGNLDLGMPGGVLAYARYGFLVDGPLVCAWIAAGVAGGIVMAIRRRDSHLALFAAYALIVFIGLSLIGTRLPHYLLPIYPAAALAAAGLYSHLATPERLTASPRAVLVPALALALALSLFFHGVNRPPHGHFLPSPEAHELGQKARKTGVPGPIYTLDWYAPALGYYADRHWHLLAAAPAMQSLDSMYLFRRASNIHAVPPWPRGAILLAGRRDRLGQLPALRIRQILAQSGPYVLVLALAAIE